MADVKISALPAATNALAAMELPVNDAGTSRKVTVGKVQYLLGHEVLGSAQSSFTELVFAQNITRIWGHALIKASTALVPRIRLGNATALDSGGNYATGNALPNTAAVTSVSFNAMNIVVAALASGNESMIDFVIVKPGTGRPARCVWLGCGISVAAATAPTMWQGNGIWVNTADLIGRLNVFGFTALTGTTAANMDAGSELTVYGSAEV